MTTVNFAYLATTINICCMLFEMYDRMFFLAVLPLWCLQQDLMKLIGTPLSLLLKHAKNYNNQARIYSATCCKTSEHE